MKNKSKKSLVQIPVSMQLKNLNKDLINPENEIILHELDGISEMLVNYVKKPEDKPMRFKFIGTLIMFLSRYRYFTKSENLNIVKIIILNELYKKNVSDYSVMTLIKNEMRFSENNAAAFKSVIEKELRDACMHEYGILNIKDTRYRSIVKPMIRDFEDFYYSFR